MRYRPEIDGLRAIAVIPVIFFHAGLPLFDGGYVGVDVFFVISGYLITSIIVGDLEAGRFSLADFYERRARRILPALYLVTLVCVPPAALWLIPIDFKDFAESVVAVSVFSSNFLFWQESGYFEAANELKPLLHTWSLAVEEQFYLLYPLFLILVTSHGRRSGRVAVAALAVAGFLLAWWMVVGHPVAAFYTLPARSWELLLGALIAFHLAQKEAAADGKDPNGQSTARASALGAVAGGALILGAVLGFDDQMDFPGPWALVPTVGTALIILCAGANDPVGRLLRSRALVQLGLVSYSAYLWHQPLLAFARHRSVAPLSFAQISSICLACFVLAFLTWHYVEKPFRRRDRYSRRTVVGVAATLAMAFVLSGYLAARPFYAEFERRVFSRALADRSLDISSRAALLDARKQFIRQQREQNNSHNTPDETTQRRVLVLGDSVSHDVFHALLSHRERFAPLIIEHAELDDTCMDDWSGYLSNPGRHDDFDRDCTPAIAALENRNLPQASDVVVIAVNCASVVQRNRCEPAITLAQTLANAGKPIVLVGHMAIKESTSLQLRVLRDGLNLTAANAYAFASTRHSSIAAANKQLAAAADAAPRIRFMDKYRMFCNEATQSCRVFDPDFDVYFADSIHLSVAGIRLFGTLIEQAGWFGSDREGLDDTGP